MNGLDKVIEHLNHAHTYVDVNDKNIFYYVDCSVIQDYGQVETFDNEHTVYECMADIPKIVFRYCLSGLLNFQKIRFVY